jgi:hypothetical protein
VRVVASLPCYSEDNVDEQRGRGVFERSIQGLRALNSAGYGHPGSGLVLDLVYNPNGAFLAPPQAQLQVCASKSAAADMLQCNTLLQRSARGETRPCRFYLQNMLRFRGKDAR